MSIRTKARCLAMTVVMMLSSILNSVAIIIFPVPVLSSEAAFIATKLVTIIAIIDSVAAMVMSNLSVS